MFLDRPLFGCGFGQYFPESRPYLSDRSTDLPLEKARPYVQHNVFLALLTETGLLGAGLYVALLALWGRNAWRLWRWDEAPLAMRQCGLLFLALLAVYLSNAMFHDLAIIPMVNMLLFFLAGVMAGLAPAARLSERQAQARIEHFLPRTAGTTG
jgi:O-antigen ligase